jgi:hypothetical protein
VDSSRADARLRAWQEPLSGTGPFDPGAAGLPIGPTLRVVLIAGLLSGAVLGGYAGRPLQMLWSALKVPALVLLSAAVCVPAFLVVHLLLGLRDDLREVVRAVLAAMASFAVALAALAPVVAFAWATVRDYGFARAFSGLIFAMAAAAAQRAFVRHRRQLVARDPRHRHAMSAWLVLYCFVTIQLAWVLRPFIGAPGLEVRLFRESAWGNAYTEIGAIVWSWLCGS